MILLVSPKYIKDNYLVDANVDDTLIVNAITDAQEINIQELIGTKYLKTLKTQVETNTLTAQNITLLDDYLLPALIRYSLYYLPLYLNNRITAAGVVTKNTDRSTAVDSKDLDDMREELKNMADFYAQRMLRYLIANKTQYADYLNTDDISQMIGRLNAYSSSNSLNLSGKQFVVDRVKNLNRSNDNSYYKRWLLY
jgi:hypothetical protein